MKTLMKYLLAVSGALVFALGGSVASADNGPGISDDEILICSYPR